jgi:lysophospholipase L1-like esterase
MNNVVLFGDSMLARFRKPHIQHLESELGPGATVFNCATGGHDSTDGVRRAPVLGKIDCTTVVLSFGGNDCAPWKQVPLDQFTENITTIVAAFEGARPVAFLPPVIEEILRPGLGMRTNKELDAYRDVLRAAVGPDAALETGEILRGHKGSRTLEDDGLHLTTDSYTLLMPHLAKIIGNKP